MSDSDTEYDSDISNEYDSYRNVEELEELYELEELEELYELEELEELYELDFDFADTLALHEEIVEESDEIIRTLHRIGPKISIEKVVMIIHNDKEMPFSEFIEELHMKSMESITESGKITFGNDLLNTLASAQIQ